MTAASPMPLVFRLTVACPSTRTAMFSPVEVAYALERQGVTMADVPDAAARAHGGTILRGALGGTGIVVEVWPDEYTSPLSDEPRWNRQLTPRYERDALNVVFYALRGGSAADRWRVRAAISRTYRQLYPARPLRCRDE